MLERIKRLEIPALAILFAAAELVLGILIQIYGGKALSFSSVVLAFVFSIYLLFRSSKSFDGTTVSLALAFTVCADFCLVVIEPRKQLLAMLFFSLVQIFYFVRLLNFSLSEKERKIHLFLRLLLISIALFLTLIVLKEKTDPLSLVSMFYYANLLVNLGFSVKHFKKSLLFPIGLLCFLLCDTLVGLTELGSLYIEISEDSFLYAITHTDLNLIWLFYVPSQTLITLSTLEASSAKKKSKN